MLRTDAATGVASSLGRIEEFAVQRAAFAAGVTVAEPLWACADPEVIGRPFFVMRRVAGTAQGRQITTDPALEPHLPAVAARLGEELARIQTIRPPRPDLAFLPHIDAARHIAGFRAYLDRHPQPAAGTRMGDTLARNAYSGAVAAGAVPSRFPHRQLHAGSASEADRRSSIGNSPAGATRTRISAGSAARAGASRGSIARPAASPTREAFYRAYEAASGRRLDPERVRFWEVLANVRWAVIALQQSDRHLIQGARDLVTAIIGRRATECELELLMLLDPDGALPLPHRGRGLG